jgi:hypothetical protein
VYLGGGRDAGQVGQAATGGCCRDLVIEAGRDGERGTRVGGLIHQFDGGDGAGPDEPAGQVCLGHSLGECVEVSIALYWDLDERYPELPGSSAQLDGPLRTEPAQDDHHAGLAEVAVEC